MMALLADRERLPVLVGAWLKRGTIVAIVGEVERLEEQARKLGRVIRRTKDAALLDDDSTESLN